MDKRSKILQIARYLETGAYSRNQIASIIHVSKNKVSVIKEVMGKNCWTASDLEQLSEEVLLKSFRRKDVVLSDGAKESMYYMPDFDQLSEELLKPGVTKSLLYEEYVAECERAGRLHYQITQFKYYFDKALKKKPFSEIIKHKPADETEVDWTGDPAKWTDPDTGEVVKGWLFVGVLPFSRYGYAEVFPDMKISNWITAHVHMFEYFGGTTRTIICDNL